MSVAARGSRITRASWLEESSPAASEVRAGLTAPRKRLPPWLFYDDEGSRLFELITELPEYYLTRAERSILEKGADDIVAAAAQGSEHALQVAELGAGTAIKSQVLLRAVVRRQGKCRFLAVDVSTAALSMARSRIEEQEPDVDVRPVAARFEDALPHIHRLGPTQLVLFLGSSIGNLEDQEATALLRSVRGAMAPGGALLLGVDQCKDPAALIAAYDDAQGVTARFNKNMLARINRELGGRFVLDRFRHVALWNAGLSRMEMHLESTIDQIVAVAALGIEVPLRKGEWIHTESSRKYDRASVARLLRSGGFEREVSFEEESGRFCLHLARADPNRT
ncbi:MAG: L-histidine N(alpha)-methyltransferase [Deltaproteobacteria bacterium]|nr:L-histidine N(alpha)-methyltransferase [Deltaproteobacteria bacterium]